jgi:cytochrome c oxidase subunit 4
MSDTDTADTSTIADGHDAAHDHPSDWAYVKIAAILAAITLVEVSTYFTSVVDWGDALIPSLMVMMVIKFWLVATWFMHLKFDNPIFGRLFVAGLVLAVGVYVAALAAFEFWA